MTETQKVVLSNRYYFRPDSAAHLKHIQDSLTYKIEKKTGHKSKFKTLEIVKNFKMLPKGIISIPQGRGDLLPSEFVLVDKRIIHEVPFPDPKFPLRDGQLEVWNDVDDTCFINALVGWGKTFTALHIAHKLKQKTLIITHTTALRDQWIEEIQTLFGIQAGIIGSGLFDIEDHCFVVGNVQTVTKMLPELCKEFGTVILDEAHHVSAETFSSLVDGMYARYRIALSGTMIRADGKHVLFRDFFGPKVLQPPASHTLSPKILLVPTGIHLPAGEPWVKKINALLYDKEYQDLIASLARVQIVKGHKVLVIADRVEFLTNVKETLGADCILITGNTAYEERKALISGIETGKVSCIAGSRQIFSEGLSVNPLSCVILCSPTSNEVSLEQIIGRIMRLSPDKLQPVVLDMQFSSPVEKAQAKKRIAFYMNKGWEILNV